MHTLHQGVCHVISSGCDTNFQIEGLCGEAGSVLANDEDAEAQLCSNTLLLVRPTCQHCIGHQEPWQGCQEV